MLAAIKALLAYQEKQYQHEYEVADPGLKFVVEDVATPEVVYADDTTEDSLRISILHKMGFTL